MTIEIREAGIAQNGIKALDTNGNQLSIGEYEVELVWQYWNGEYQKWISLPEDRKATYANSFWEFSNFAVKTKQVYIASVAPEREQIPVNCLHAECTECGAKVDVIPADGTFISKPIAPESKEINRDWDEDKSHENGSYVCVCRKCGFYFIGHKRRAVCKVCVEPEKEVDTNLHQRAKIAQCLGEKEDTIEQVLREALAIQSKRAEDLLIERNEFREFIKTQSVLIKNLKRTHVPIEEVVSIIDEHVAFHNKLKSSASIRGIMHQLERVKDRIRLLIKDK